MKNKIMSTVLASALTLSGAVSMADVANNLNDNQVAQVAFTANKVEQKFADLAMATSKSTAITKYADRVTKAHAEANTKLEALLTSAGLARADSDLNAEIVKKSQANYDALKPKTGHDFDVGYINWEISFLETEINIVDPLLMRDVQNMPLKDFLTSQDQAARVDLKVAKIVQGMIGPIEQE